MILAKYTLWKESISGSLFCVSCVAGKVMFSVQCRCLYIVTNFLFLNNLYIYIYINQKQPRYLSQCSVWLRTGRPGFDPWQRQRIFPLASVSIPPQRPTQPLIQWVLGVLSPGVKRGQGVTLPTHPHLLPRSRISRSYNYSPPKRHHGV
jgi:hypothetical protein